MGELVVDELVDEEFDDKFGEPFDDSEFVFVVLGIVAVATVVVDEDDDKEKPFVSKFKPFEIILLLFDSVVRVDVALSNKSEELDFNFNGSLSFPFV